MRVLAACSLGGAGHLRPLLPFLDAARRAGHQTLLVAPPSLAALVGASGHRFHPGAVPDEEQIAPLRERLPVAPPAEASVLGNRELFGRLATGAMRPTMAGVVADWRPDLVLREPCEYASALEAGSAGVRIAQVAISSAQGEAASLDDAAPALEQWRAGLTDELRAMTYVTRFPPSLDPSPFPRTLRYHEVTPPRGRLEDRWAGSGGPLVYVTGGTVLGHMTIAADVYRTLVAGVAGPGRRVLLTVGHRFDAGRLGPLPPYVVAESWVDQDAVLGEAALVVCHGGSGTVFAAAAAGVPLVVVPVFADQFENGRRVAAAGAGEVVERAQDVGGARSVIGPEDAPRVARAVERVLADPSYRRAAERLGAEMGATPVVDDVVADLLEGPGRSS